MGMCRECSKADQHVPLTLGVCSWPFRATEIEMNLSYKYPADMWSVGLIALELLSGCDWYHGKRPVKEKKAPLLRGIESLVGLITEDAWKGVSQSASWQEYRRTWPCDPLATATPFTTPARPLPMDGEQLANSIFPVGAKGADICSGGLAPPILR